jgi:phospholipase/carboxylesterase/glyoxalase family protein
MNHIHRFIQGEAPETLLLLHGTGGNEDDLLPVGRELAPGWNLLSPRGNVLEHGMPRFFRRLAEGVFDQQDLRFRTQELNRFLADAAREYGIDRSRIFATGYSNGANIAASLLLTDPGALAGAILLRPMLPFGPDSTIELNGLPVFVGAGRNDRVIPPGSPDRLITVLRQAGATVTEFWHPGGHELTRQDLENARLWLAGLGTMNAK